MTQRDPSPVDHHPGRIQFNNLAAARPYWLEPACSIQRLLALSQAAKRSAGLGVASSPGRPGSDSSILAMQLTRQARLHAHTFLLPLTKHRQWPARAVMHGCRECGEVCCFLHSWVGMLAQVTPMPRHRHARQSVQSPRTVQPLWACPLLLSCIVTDAQNIEVCVSKLAEHASTSIKAPRFEFWQLLPRSYLCTGKKSAAISICR